VLGFLVFVLGVLVVAALLFLGAAVLMGRGESQPPAELDRSPVELPDDRAVTGDDLRELRISVSARGYRMTEVDWLLEQFAEALDERDEEIASLRARLAEQQDEGLDAGPADDETPEPPAADDRNSDEGERSGA
jgi:DivIVA domain-containing protein